MDSRLRGNDDFALGDDTLTMPVLPPEVSLRSRSRKVRFIALPWLILGRASMLRQVRDRFRRGRERRRARATHSR